MGYGWEDDIVDFPETENFGAEKNLQISRCSSNVPPNHAVEFYDK